MMGLPLIATNVGGIPEIITDGVNGFLVKNYDANDAVEKINEILNDKIVFERMKKNSKEIFNEKFSRANICSSKKDATKEILSALTPEAFGLMAIVTICRLLCM